MRVDFGDVLFDSGAHELRRGGKPVRVSRKAFRLLEVLIERRPDVVSQQELYDSVWPGTFVDIAGLHNLVSQVRAAIGDEKHEVIRTVHGVGFAFAAATGEERPKSGSPELSSWTLSTREEMFVLPLGKTIVGRGAESDVTISRPTISRYHAALHVTADSVLVEDLGSKNGTFVNDVRITAPVTVSAPDEMRFGKVRARVTADAATASETATATSERR